MGVHLNYFMGGGSLKAQGVISSWMPELEPRSLGDTNAHIASIFDYVYEISENLNDWVLRYG